MPEPAPDPAIVRRLLLLQKNEITEHHIYRRIAAITPEAANRGVLLHIADEELGHYRIWGKYTGQEPGPSRVRVGLYALAARIFGMTFTIKLMEGVEQRARQTDPALAALVTELPRMLANEEAHERELIALLNEERLKYVGSVVLGLNDALVEFTATLAGLTFALQNARIIAVAGLITGIAATLSMGASEYLSQKSDEGAGDPFIASIYTGLAYILTVAILILPYLLTDNPYLALLCTLAAALVIIVVFTFYIAVAKDLPFKKRFLEMAAISIGVSVISFLLGLAIRLFLHVNV